MIHRASRIAASAVIACLALGLALDLAAPSAQAEPAAEPTSGSEAASARRRARTEAMTEDAVTRLRRGADFLAGQQRFSFGAEVTYDILQSNGVMLEFGASHDILVRRPDRLRIQAVRRDGDVKQLFFDGQSLTIDMPREDAYVKVAKPGTLYAALDYLVNDLGDPSPLEDFLSENFMARVGSRITAGFHVEYAAIGDRVCEHLAFRTDELDFQIWIEDAESPLPCRLVITYTRSEGSPQFTADFRDWNLEPVSDDGMFAFEPPASAERLQVQALERALREPQRIER